MKSLTLSFTETTPGMSGQCAETQPCKRSRHPFYVADMFNAFLNGISEVKKLKSTKANLLQYGTGRLGNYLLNVYLLCRQWGLKSII